MAYNKIIYGGKTLIDLTGDTVTADRLLKGTTAHDMSGEVITGSCNFDSDTSGATAAVAEILAGKTAFARGSKVTGTMPNNGSVKKTITKKADKISIAQGYHDGSGYVSIDEVEQEKLIADNIRSGITILGVKVLWKTSLMGAGLPTGVPWMRRLPESPSSFPSHPL